MSTVEPTAVLVDGPWRHRDVPANGTRFHVAECGPDDAPLVLLVHGFPEFWWCWRHQLRGLAGRGFRVAACDLRGYGASDKPPRGYDPFTLSADLAGLVRALGERSAVVAGHDWGGFLGWTAATVFPGLVRRLVVLSMPHPTRLRRVLVSESRGQRRHSAYIARFQLPWAPERLLVDDDGAYVAELLRSWGGPGFPDEETERRVREAIQIPAVAHCALEYYRWAFRSLFRSDGWRLHRIMQSRLRVPTRQVHGSVDGCLLPGSALGSDAYVDADYDWCLLDGVGHFPHEESPEVVTDLIAEWAAG